jgi:hypothetical protein
MRLAARDGAENDQHSQTAAAVTMEGQRFHASPSCWLWWRLQRKANSIRNSESQTVPKSIKGIW